MFTERFIGSNKKRLFTQFAIIEVLRDTTKTLIIDAPFDAFSPKIRFKKLIEFKFCNYYLQKAIS